MTTKTVTVDKRLLLSIPLGICIGFVFIFLSHYFGEWRSRGGDPFFSGPKDSFLKKSYITNKSFLDRDDHLTFDLKSLDDVKSVTYKLSYSLSNTFSTGHIKHYLIFSFLGTLLVFVFKRVKFQVK